MKITNGFPFPELDPDKQRVEKPGAVDRAASGYAGDRDENPVRVSEKARLLLSLMNHAEAVPETPTAGFEAIQRAVSESRYVVSPERIADSMLDSLARFPEGI